MKTEAEIAAKLETVIADMNRIADEGGPVPTQGQQIQAGFLLGAMTIIAWITDAEEALRPLVTACKIQALANKMKDFG
jgi:phosphate uptake regulator